MSLKIRLSRGGAKKRPFYRIVVADARMPRDGRFVEKIGTFDPVKPKDDALRLVLDVEKAKAWLAKGAQPTDRVLRLRVIDKQAREVEQAREPGHHEYNVQRFDPEHRVLLQRKRRRRVRTSAT